MTKPFFIGLLSLALAACGGETAREGSSSSSRTIASGTRIEATIRDEITSLHNVVGQSLTATVSQDVTDAKGRVVIAAGSPVLLHISAISPAPAGETNSEGRLELTVTAVTVNGTAHNERIVVTSIPHTMKGRGITKGVAENLVVGTAVGAVIGQAIGKNPRSTIIGGAVGAVAGGAVSVAGAQRDIVTAPGTRISFTLPNAITVAVK